LARSPASSIDLVRFQAQLMAPRCSPAPEGLIRIKVRDLDPGANSGDPNHGLRDSSRSASRLAPRRGAGAPGVECSGPPPPRRQGEGHLPLGSRPALGELRPEEPPDRAHRGSAAKEKTKLKSCCVRLGEQRPSTGPLKNYLETRERRRLRVGPPSPIRPEIERSRNVGLRRSRGARTSCLSNRRGL